MKTLRKTSFENFDRLSIIEASQLYGGVGDIPPTPTVPTDSIGGNKTDSIPPTTPIKPKNEIGGSIEKGKDGTGKISGFYTRDIGHNSSIGTKGWVDTKGNWGFTVDFRKKF